MHGPWRLALYLFPIVVSIPTFPPWYRGLLVLVRAIYAFYKRRRNHMQLISSANRNQYLRLMAISLVEMLGTIPFRSGFGTYFIVSNVKIGVIPWRGWAAMHSYNSSVAQVAGFIWRNDPVASRSLEL